MPGAIHGRIAADISATSGRDAWGTVDADFEDFTFKNYTYTDISLDINAQRRGPVFASLISDSPDARIQAEAEYTPRLNRSTPDRITVSTAIEHLALDVLGFEKGHPGYILTGAVDADLSNLSPDLLDGTVDINNLRWANPDDEKAPVLAVDHLGLEFNPDAVPPKIEIQGDFISGSLDGAYHLTEMPTALRDLVAGVVPSLVPPTGRTTYAADNEFTFDFTINESEHLSEFFHLPLHVVYPVNLSGYYSQSLGRGDITLDAPYLRQGDKVWENTMLFLQIDYPHRTSRGFISTEFPTKKGQMNVSGLISANLDRIDTNLRWEIDRRIPLNGTIDLSALLGRTAPTDQHPSGQVTAHLDILPGTINFGEEVWRIMPSSVDYAPGDIAVNGFGLMAASQSIAINGRVGPTEADSLDIDLRNVALLPIFETLEIDKAMIGGRATGSFAAHSLLSQAPYLRCPNLHVDSIGYNRCTLGDADIVAEWDNDRRAFNLDADILGPEGHQSRIYGSIFPMSEALDINFDASHVRVGFMKPFMEAFTSSIDGFATGKARLFGTFKEIDMEGKIYAEDLKIKIDFTNTWYTASDTIRLTPGNIYVDNVTIYDINGRTAMLNGHVGHKYFKEPTFDFRVTNARDFLSYNVTSRQSPDWYGTIYGNGGAHISGYPGVVNIGVDMATAPNSVFTFVLSDMLEAGEYSFITFRDVTPQVLTDSITQADDRSESLRRLQEGRGNATQDAPSDYNMDIRVDITPDARMIMVMDPVGGDEIKARGSGNLRMVYGSANNDLKMYGTYTLDEGSYNFTLQDIIIKDFTIKEGSSIAFHGDPYSAQLDIKAAYSLNANLSDLDESFLQDKDISRTNVPVHAILKVSGDMRQPDIDFDLEFPTLTSDTYRKVRSIISTEEMMNRQIIYLLALNRFYTPEYMGSTTKGNELFSVASSTISSQLSSMLGKLSENWSIAPNLRSDRGDFSDVEVDVALSSRLLNNRLLFNGNFGYRDNALNTNQFIGDFDIEYLLNKRGTWRLKAYNRYNDRNYYVRTAQTTQGVGIMFKRDFDNMFSFLRRHRTPSSDTIPADTVDISK